VSGGCVTTTRLDGISGVSPTESTEACAAVSLEDSRLAGITRVKDGLVAVFIERCTGFVWLARQGDRVLDGEVISVAPSKDLVRLQQPPKFEIQQKELEVEPLRSLGDSLTERCGDQFDDVEE